jgi:energy-coupling factor transporter ATP-binding protein EcfA2
MTEFCLSFDDLTLGYSGHEAVHHLSGDVTKGSLTAVVGANGSGKSNLLKGIAGLLKPLSGSVSGNHARLAYLPQLSELDRSVPARVIDLVSLGLWQKRGLLGRINREDRSDLATCLDRVGLPGLRSAPSTASPAASSRGRCSLGRCCRMPTPSCSTSRSTRSTRGQSSISPRSSAMVRRGENGPLRASRSRARQTQVRPDPAFGALPRRLGGNRLCPDGRESCESAPLRRAVGRAR